MFACVYHFNKYFFLIFIFDNIILKFRAFTKSKCIPTELLLNWNDDSPF